MNTPHGAEKEQPRGDGARDEVFLHLLLAGVAFAAGLTGVALLALPGSTPRYFSWGLLPSPLAALIGGSYVASLLVFGVAVGRPWREVRGLVAGTLALTLPILAATFLHLDTFDFGRWQAWAWVLVFIASPLAFGTALLLRRGTAGPAGLLLPAPIRALAMVLFLGFVTLAVSLWWNPAAVSRILPFPLPPLGGRVLASWSSFLAFLAIWSALRGRDEAWIPLVGLAAFSAGALLGAVRTLGDLDPTRRGSYVAVLSCLFVATFLAAVREVRRGGASG